MGGAVAVEEGEQGQLVAVKRSSDQQHCEILRREAAVLDLARLPGVVALADHSEAADQGELRTNLVSQRTLARPGRLSAANAARIGAALATTLADLHRIGVSHGALRTDHVLLDRSGSPVLCGFGVAGLRYAVGEHPAGGFDPPGDIESFGALLAAVSDTTLRPVPWQRNYLRNRAARAGIRQIAERLRNRGTSPVNLDAIATELTRLAAPARGDLQPAETTSGATALTSATRELPRRTIPRRPPVIGPAPEVGTAKVTRRRLFLALGATVLAIVAGAGTVAAVRSWSEGPPAVDIAMAATSFTIAETTTSTMPAAPLAPAKARTCPPSIEELRSSGLPTECLAVAQVAGNRVTLLGATFELGSSSDQAVLADEDCDGYLEAALYEKSTSRVFVFGKWPAPGEALTATSSLPVKDVSALLATETAGCLRLQVRHADGAVAALGAATP